MRLATTGRTAASMGKGEISAAVRVTALRLREADDPQRLSGVYSFKSVGPGEPFLAKAQISMQ